MTCPSFLTDLFGFYFIYNRGTTFRPDYLEAVTLRGIFTKACTLGLSATVNNKVKTDIDQLLHWKPYTVALLPDRPNIYLEVVHKANYLIASDLKWIVEGLSEQGNNFPKTVIFAQTKGVVNDIHAFIKRSLGDKAYHNEVKEADNRLISKYHGSVSDDLQKWTLTQMANPSSNLKVIATTVAWGMGVDVKDIRTVVVFGACKNMLIFWQQIGRAGRDGEPSRAVWYPKSTVSDDKDLFDSMKNETDKCIRRVILSHFVLPQMGESCLDFLDNREQCDRDCEFCECDLCRCCSHCRAKCKCRV